MFASSLRRVGAVATSAALVLALGATPVSAAGIVVNSLADNAADDGVCTLREAIIAANSDTASGASGGECVAGSSGADVITFSVSGTITLTDDLPDIQDDLTIDGGGSITIDGDGGFRQFWIGGGTVVLDGLELTAGEANDGGAILNKGTLSVIDSNIHDNLAFQNGGGIYSDEGGSLTVTNSTIAENEAEGLGGGIYSLGELTVTNSSVSENVAGEALGGIYNAGGGSISGSRVSENQAPEAAGIGNEGETTLTITDSTISLNAASDGDGGGIFNRGTLTVTGSTIGGNTTTGYGGGIYNVEGATATVANSTIVGNEASLDGGGIHNDVGSLTVINVTISDNFAAQSGGGVYDFEAGTFHLLNTIVAGNTANDGEDDLDGTPDTDTNNLIGTGALTLDDILDPAGLSDNGGPTETIALVDDESNPAVDGGDWATCSAAPVNGVDQRGVARDGGACDIGAYEIAGPIPTDPPTTMATGPAGESSAPSLPAILVILASGLLVLTTSRLATRRR